MTLNVALLLLVLAGALSSVAFMQAAVNARSAGGGPGQEGVHASLGRTASAKMSMNRI
ncbi:hypothetical protein ACFWCF_24305 [Rhodococcus sp. NPDC060090]|uniref:hypothetical protein n=1 Tax=Rhodococcus sp. NPDC060090 TaxID=3347056 RepID=UPI0036658EF1